jgi:hypothetical protein
LKTRHASPATTIAVALAEVFPVMPAPARSRCHDQTNHRRRPDRSSANTPEDPMDNQNRTQMTPTGENQNDAEPAIDGWSAFWSVLLGAGFAVYVSFIRIGNAHKPPLYWRLQSLFVLLAAAAISAMALAGMTRATNPRPKHPAAQDLA